MPGLGLQVRQRVAAPEDLGTLALVIRGKFTRGTGTTGPDGHGTVHAHRWPGWLSVFKIHTQSSSDGNERHGYLRSAAP